MSHIKELIEKVREELLTSPEVVEWGDEEAPNLGAQRRTAASNKRIAGARKKKRPYSGGTLRFKGKPRTQRLSFPKD